MKKILIVDDEANIRELMKMALTLCKFDVVAASDGKEAIDLALKEKPDLIITDHLMPGFSGYDLMRKLRENDAFKQIPFIMCTGKRFDGEFPELLKIDNCNFIAKPFDINQFISTIEKTLGLAPGELK